jgi:hypothetical protein
VVLVPLHAQAQQAAGGRGVSSPRAGADPKLFSSHITFMYIYKVNIYIVNSIRFNSINHRYSFKGLNRPHYDIPLTPNSLIYIYIKRLLNQTDKSSTFE